MDESSIIAQGRQHPFKIVVPDDVAYVHENVNRVMIGVEDMLFGLVRHQSPQWMRYEDMQDVVQDCMLHLTVTSLPRYDAWRKPRVLISTYVNQCARNFISTAVTKLKRQYLDPETVTTMDVDAIVCLPAPDTFNDENITAIAEDFIRNPERFLNSDQARVARQLIDNHELKMREHAEQLNYRCQSSLSMIVRRIKEKIIALDVQCYAQKKGTYSPDPGNES